MKKSIMETGASILEVQNW